MSTISDLFKEWVEIQESHARFSFYTEYDNYYNGQQDLLKLLPVRVQKVMEQELRVTSNICKLIIDTKTQYLCGNPVNIQVTGTPEGNPDDPFIKQAERDLYFIYNNTYNLMLHQNMAKLISSTSKHGDGFVKVYIDTTIPPDINYGILSQIQIRVISPKNVYPKYKTDDYQQMKSCAIKSIEFDEKGNSIIKAQNFYTNIIQFYEWREAENSQYSAWELVDEQPNILGFIPIWHFKNSVDDLEFGISDLQAICDLQDSISKTLTDMTVIMDTQAFQRLAIMGAERQDIDLSPNSIIFFPDTETRIDQIPPATLEPLLSLLKKLEDNAFMIAQIPQIAIGRIEGGALSGYALRIHYLPLEAKCTFLKASVQDNFRDINAKIFKMLAMLGYTDYTKFEAKTKFDIGLPIDEANQLQVASQKYASGAYPKEYYQQDIGIEDTEEANRLIDKERLDVYGGTERLTAEAENIANTLSATEPFATPKPEEIG